MFACFSSAGAILPGSTIGAKLVPHISERLFAALLDQLLRFGLADALASLGGSAVADTDEENCTHKDGQSNLHSFTDEAIPVNSSLRTAVKFALSSAQGL